MWELSHRGDASVVPLADRHYNRQKIGAPQFAPPGRCLVLATPERNAFWITSWPFAQYVKHAWPGAWINSAFRREGDAPLASSLICDGVAATLWRWPDPPALGMVTFIDPRKVRHKRDIGRCYRKAGFHHVGFTKGGLYAFQLLPSEMPDAAAPLGQFDFAIPTPPAPPRGPQCVRR